MSSLLTLGQTLEQKSKAQHERTAAMLKAAFSEHEQSVKAELNASAKRISDAISAHEQGMNEAMRSNRLNVLRMVGRTWLTVTMVSVLLIGTCGSVLWWQGEMMFDNYQFIQEQKNTQAMLSEKNNGVQLSTCGNEKRRCVRVNAKAGRYGEDSDWMILAGK
ncbi:MbeB family mobilization protein (plasmid) [Edwardsiella tarda]|uniref:MbeB family mobilization protein n=1 Tax=Edwardsiella tarda TaxID=636 RepID=UPI0011B25114|nr:MbeB family mobilization protein [Edwardsiella tarda]